MSTTRKVVIGLGIAGGALLAAWLLTGDRKTKTRSFIVKRAGDLRRSLKKEKAPATMEEPEYTYV